MLSYLLRIWALLALLCLGGPVLATVPANAQTVQFEFNQNGGRVVVPGPDCSREPRRNDPRCRPDWREERRDDRRDRYDRSCTPEQALDKAERLGIRRARLETFGRRFVEVSGRSNGRWVTVVFARDRGCPIVRR